LRWPWIEQNNNKKTTHASSKKTHDRHLPQHENVRVFYLVTSCDLIQFFSGQVLYTSRYSIDQLTDFFGKGLSVVL